MQSPNLPGFVVGVLILALSFSLLERLFPSLLAPRKGTFRPGAITDLGYLFFNAFITKQLIRFFNLVLLGLGMLLVSGSFDRSLLDGHGILMQQPPYLLLVEMILLADFITYWMHRLLHANVSFNFCVFKYIVSTPQFHRWHHSRSEEAIDKNFAGLFPVFFLSSICSSVLSICQRVKRPTTSGSAPGTFPKASVNSLSILL